MKKQKYSGRTTAYEHQNTKWQSLEDENKIINYEDNPDYLTDGKIDWNKVPHKGKNAIQTKTIFEVQWSDCPVEVEKEVKKLWRDMKLGNDHYYYRWEKESADDYPTIAKYLKSKNVKNCLIHWWW